MNYIPIKKQCTLHPDFLWLVCRGTHSTDSMGDFAGFLRDSAVKTATLSQANLIVDDAKDAFCERMKNKVNKARRKPAKVSCKSNYYRQWVLLGPRSVRSLYKQDTNMRNRTCLR